MSTGNSSGNSSMPMSEINVTPMVDVMLVLLIIFMVTAPMMQQGVAVALPQTKARALQLNEETLVLTVTADKRVYLGDVQIAYTQLQEKLSANEKLKRDGEMYLHADRDLSYGVVVDVMAIMKESGVRNLGMVTDPLGKAKRNKKKKRKKKR